jgi:hypothetical protein
MKRHIRFMACLVFASCSFGQIEFVHADEREELKARVAELEQEAERYFQEGKPDQVVRVKRERSELMSKLMKLQSEFDREAARRGQGRGGEKRENPDMPPEMMEKVERAKQQINHLRIASEQLKLAQKHDMAHDLMRQAEEVERDIQQAIAQQKNRHSEREQVERQRAERMEKRRHDEMMERERQTEKRNDLDRRESDKERSIPERAFVRPSIVPPMTPPKAREEAMQGLQKEIKQLREENREIRQMMERISQELKRMQSRD